MKQTDSIKGFNHNLFERGWALLNEDGKVKNVCANCGNFTTCENHPHWDGRPCESQSLLMKEEI